MPQAERMPQMMMPRDPRRLRIAAQDQRRELSGEYKSIPTYMPSEQELPRDVSVREKNRYTNVLPNPDTRVPLSKVENDPASFYINANYVSGYQTPRKYIATQGPINSTLNDFWRMIWEQDVRIIAMTTGLVEGGRAKCNRYWPDQKQGSLDFDHIRVTVTDTEDCGAWVLSHFKVSNSATNEERDIKHYWYTGWPDHGVPDQAGTVIEFLRSIHTANNALKSTSPIIVHCSAGIGRTGTFMAIDIGIHELQGDWRVTDILGNVTKMRQERGGSVQTEIQYRFVHQALMEYSTPGFKHGMFHNNKPRDVELKLSDQHPYLGFTIRGSYPPFIVSVDAGGLAEIRGVKKGDTILKINGIDAARLRHKDCVDLIKKSGEELNMTLLARRDY